MLYWFMSLFIFIKALQEKRKPIYGAVFFIVAVLACTTAGLIINNNLQVSLNKVQCSLYTSLNDFIYGVPANNTNNLNWIGISSVTGRLSNVIAELRSNKDRL
jgi:hypothetical protein